MSVMFSAASLSLLQELRRVQKTDQRCVKSSSKPRHSLIPDRHFKRRQATSRRQISVNQLSPINYEYVRETVLKRV